MAKGKLSLQERSSREGCAGLRASPPFSDLTSEEYGKLLDVAYPVERDRGELVFQEGRPAEGLYVVTQGKVKLVKKTPDRQKAFILKVVGPGELLGEEPFFAGGAYATCAKALEPTRLCYLPREEVQALLDRHPRLALSCLRKAFQQVQEDHHLQVELAYERSEVRLARALLRLGGKFGRREGEVESIDLDLSRAELAELVGLRPETAIRILSGWRSEGILVLENRRLVITQRSRLAGIAQLPPAEGV